MSTDHPPPGSTDDAYRAEVTASGRFQIGSYNEMTNVELSAGTMPPPQRAGAGTTPHNLPAASGVFEGRDLQVMAGLLGGADTGVVVGQAAAVHGLGGIGKSELANHYARTNLDRYSLVWWITADSSQSVELGLAALTKRLHPVATLADAQTWAVGWLQSQAGWLLVLDNVEDVADITGLIGVVAGRGHLLVTTRRNLGTARWARLGLTPLRLEVLDRAASVRLLARLTGLGDNDGNAGRLAQVLGDLPLALQQAAAYISQHAGTGFDDYRQLLVEEFDRAAADPGEGEASNHSVAAVWTVTMTAITERSPLAVEILRVLAWLAPDELPDTVLDPLADNPRDVGDALAVLASYSMISREPGGVSVHRLVQAVTRSTVTAAGTALAVQNRAVELLAKAAPEDPIRNVAGWPLWAVLLPHVSVLAGNISPDRRSTIMLYLQDRAATFQQFQGNLTAAITEFEQVLTDRRRVLGEDHPDTLVSRNNLALAYQMAGQLAKAITGFEQVLTDRPRVLGQDHQNTLASRHNLAEAYRVAGRVVEAITGFEQVITDSRRVLGDDHPDTLTSRNNLASAHQAAGRITEAITGFEQVLTDRRRVLGDDHPDTLTSRNNLASAHQTAIDETS